jgi:type 1 glutamine amidotransferase
MSTPQSFRFLVLLTTALGFICGKTSNAIAAGPPPPPIRAEVERALAAARTARDEPLRPLTIVLLADRKDHGENEHDYPRWQERWALLLGGERASQAKAVNLYGPDIPDANARQGAREVEVIRAWGWPETGQWEKASLVVAYCYIEWTAARKTEVERFLARGGGLVLIHSATWTRPEPSAEVAVLTGVGGFQHWRHGALEVELDSEHPICRGLPRRISLVDEPYWPPTPPFSAEGVEVLGSSREETSPGSGHTELQPLIWTRRFGEGRVFGCVPGHYTWTFDNPWFRALLLRGMAWAAGDNPYRFDKLVMRGITMADE